MIEIETIMLNKLTKMIIITVYQKRDLSTNKYRGNQLFYRTYV